MNHAFNPSKLNVTVCAICKRNMMAHLTNAECEACGKPDINTIITPEGNKVEKSALEIVNDILMCRSCLSRELEVAVTPVTSEPIPDTIVKLEEQRFEKPSDKIASIAKSALADLPQNGNEYFNAEVIDHIELEKKIMADDNIPANEKYFFFAKQLQLRQQHLAKVLMSVKDLWLETKNRSAAIHQDLNMLASKLRKEEKEQLHLQDVSYVPTIPNKRVGVPRMKAEDRVIESVAKLLFAPKVNGIVQWEALTREEREKYLNMARNTFKGTKKEVADLSSDSKS